MTDRELLELAAKAAGIEIFGWDKNGAACIDPVEYSPWNPLRSLVQAEKLKYSLGIITGFDDRFSEFGPCAYATYKTGDFSCDSVFVNIDDAGGANPALCRAIVRAASEIGKAMP